jgi:hypothetical protein
VIARIVQFDLPPDKIVWIAEIYCKNRMPGRDTRPTLFDVAVRLAS